MTSTKRETNHSSSIHQKIRKAGFIPVSDASNETFKYKVVYKLQHRLRKLLTRLKDWSIKTNQRFMLWLSNYDWKAIRSDVSIWTVETFIEGLTVNIATHVLFDVGFNPGTIFAHGIIIKQGLSIYWRLRQNGSNPTIPKKHN